MHKVQQPETLETGFSIRGGALYRFQEMARVIRPKRWSVGRRILIAVLIGWVPLVALTAMSGSRASLVALLKDYRVLARVFIAVPLLIAGKPLIRERFRLMVKHFSDAGLLGPADSPKFRSILTTIKRLEHAWFPKLALVAFGSVSGFLFVRNHLMFDAPWSVRVIGTSITQSSAGWYFELVTQTIYMVLLGRALWEWVLYVLFFWRVSWLQLQLVPCDPDQSGGLGFLGYSLTAFIPVVIAASTAMGSALCYQASHSVFSRASPMTVLALWVAVILLIFVGPLAIFGPKLALLHRMGSLQYGSLAHLHAEQFHEKWVQERRGHMGELLAAREIMALNNLAASFDRLRKMNPLPVDKITLIELTAAAAVPMIPAIMTQVPLTELLRMIFRALL
jgi:hypothetical protein